MEATPTRENSSRRELSENAAAKQADIADIVAPALLKSTVACAWERDSYDCEKYREMFT